METVARDGAHEKNVRPHVRSNVKRLADENHGVRCTGRKLRAQPHAWFERTFLALSRKTSTSVCSGTC